MTNSKSETIQYQMEIPLALWRQFKRTLDRNQTIDKHLIKLIRRHIEQDTTEHMKVIPNDNTNT